MAFVCLVAWPVTLPDSETTCMRTQISRVWPEPVALSAVVARSTSSRAAYKAAEDTTVWPCSKAAASVRRACSISDIAALPCFCGLRAACTWSWKPSANTRAASGTTKAGCSPGPTESPSIRGPTMPSERRSWRGRRPGRPSPRRPPHRRDGGPGVGSTYLMGCSTPSMAARCRHITRRIDQDVAERVGMHLWSTPERRPTQALVRRQVRRGMRRNSPPQV